MKMSDMEQVKAARARCWDPVVRLTHWGILGAVLANGAFLAEGGSWHVWVGTAMAGLLGLRLVWGLIGPAEARFTSFPPSPAQAIAHIRDIVGGRHQAHPSHNGLGALMTYAIWATLLVVAVTGFSMSGLPPTAKAEPVAREVAAFEPTRAMVETHDDDDERAEAEVQGLNEGGEGWSEDVHEAAVNLLYGLILLHILGVILESVRGGPRVIGRMIGRGG